MSVELVSIVIVGVSQLIGLALLGWFLNHEFQAQLRRNMALEAQFQKWNADQTVTISQRIDQILDMLRTGKL
jgi:hypothetical protein